MLNLPDNAVGPILAAIIAGVLTFLGLVIAKEHKVSDFRQNWIDELRSDTAELISRLSVIISTYREWSEDEKMSNSSLLHDHFVSVNQALMRIRLRLNPTEQDSKIILQILDKIQENFNGDDPDYDQLEKTEPNLINSVRKVLKKEWNRVRKGEPIFIISKWIAAITIILLIIIIVFYLISSL